MNIDEIGGKKNFITKIKSLIINSPEISHVSDLHHLSVYNNSESLNLNSSNIIAKRSISSSFVKEPQNFNIFLFNHDEVMRVFWTIFTLTIVGEFFEAPSVSLLDTAVLQCIDNYHNYGHVRLYGSLGFGISSFVVGFTLDHVRKNICNKVVTNFMVIMYFFIAWMVVTIAFCIICVRFPERTSNGGKSELSIVSTLKVFSQPLYAIFLISSLYLGFTHGSIMNFINWYLEDMGANRFMMGTATILRDFAVVLGFYLSPNILENFRMKYIMIWVFNVYIFSYFCYSLIPSPWMAVPVEALQGLAFSIMWSASINYLVEASDPTNFATMQGKILLFFYIFYFYN